MKKLFKAALAGLFALTAFAPAIAAEKGTAPEAIAMAKKAVAFLKANGKEKAFAEFNNATGQFRDRDLYVMVFDMKGMSYAHGANSKLIGRNLIDLTDADGRMIVKGFIDIATTKGTGWHDYNWPNPTTKAIEKKTTYVEKADDLLIGVGIYK